MKLHFQHWRSVKTFKDVLVAWILVFGAFVLLGLASLVLGGVKDYPRFAAVLRWVGLLYTALGVIYLLITPERDSVWRLSLLLSVVFVAFFAILLVNGKCSFLHALVLWP